MKRRKVTEIVKRQLGPLDLLARKSKETRIMNFRSDGDAERAEMLVLCLEVAVLQKGMERE